MTVSTTTNRAGFVCNGVTYQFPFDFKILAESDLQVYLYNTITRLTSQLTLNVDYTVEIASPGPGGTVTLIGAYGPPCPPGVIPGAQYTLTILRAMPRTQEIDFVNGDDLDEQNIEGMGDRITMMVQELDNKMARTLAFPPTSGISNISVPDPVPGAFLRWNLSGNGLENATYVDPTLITISDYWRAVIDGGDTLPEALTAMGLDPSLSTLTLPDNVTISDFIKTLLDDNDAAAARTTLGLPANLETLTLPASTTISDFMKTLLDDTTAAAARMTLGSNYEGMWGGKVYHGLKIIRPTVATVKVTCDEAVLANGFGHGKRFSSINATANIANSGANGLDTGSEAASTWYHIFLIGKDDGTCAILLSVSPTSPTLPSGYTYSLRIGAVRNDISSNFVDFCQSENSVAIPVTTVLAAGTKTSYTAIDMSTTIPSFARTAFGSVMVTGSGANDDDCGAAIAATSSGLGEVSIYLTPTGANVTTCAIRSYWEMLLVDVQIVYYKLVYGDDVNVRVSGWRY